MLDVGERESRPASRETKVKPYLGFCDPRHQCATEFRRDPVLNRGRWVTGLGVHQPQPEPAQDIPSQRHCSCTTSEAQAHSLRPSNFAPTGETIAIGSPPNKQRRATAPGKR
ncbi:hypothetical protein HBH56_060980 [Parastagonospora nodorum]|uniref:Uncharacterized protein n=1 Tax=Phaeosphaeria nodorum (strain SN15 / ATCC MYA-4574 / FGSC 10173) TaxID=321614 RepID=A0A7U2HU39_PHANO|nr:hypothetical protein HBH56_060980 [Parastagonospora nodorum]QRC91935.1 hypothetical protein JI435_021090 [Parastagonospora nodorum SN15]KAH3931031.1 hypothetical protein HBH54_104910 [Parastagonospora nodorum]KAH3968041.1 hypothetical protein HBH51_133880 [Parastagonospora nodorum]KAH4074099.1 hypothetical protein HBH50_042580 [Parastagonospora nodorum]